MTDAVPHPCSDARYAVSGRKSRLARAARRWPIAPATSRNERFLEAAGRGLDISGGQGTVGCELVEHFDRHRGQELRDGLPFAGMDSPHAKPRTQNS